MANNKLHTISKITICIFIMCLLGSGFAFGGINEGYSINNGILKDSIKILIEDKAIEYIEGLENIEYYADVKYIYNDLTEDILDPSTVKWSIKSDGIAEIKENGAIVPKGEGSFTLFAEYNGLKDSIDVEIKKGKIQKLEVSKTDVFLNNSFNKKENQNPCSLYAFVTTSSGEIYDVTYDKNIVWKSSDDNIADVIDGQVYAINEGKAKIHAEFNGLLADTQVIVEDKKPVKFKIKKNKNESIEENTVDEAKLIVEYDDGSSDDISMIATWETEDPDIALVYEGKICAQKAGITKIKVSYGEFSDSYEIKVKKEKDLSKQKYPFP